jgi:hypothetical protein
MSTAASNGKTVQTISVGGRVNPGSMDKSKDKSVDKPGAKSGNKAKAPMTAEQRKHALVIGIAVLVVLGVAAGIYAYFYRPPVTDPRLNEGPDKIIAFIQTDNFDKLEFDRKMLYWKEMAGKKKEIEEMQKAGKISKKELENVLAVVYLGKQFKHIEHYNSLGDLDKKDFLDKIIDEREVEKSIKKPKGTIERNEERVKALQQTFPEQVRSDIEVFHRAIKEREKERKREDTEIKKKAAQAARSAPPARPTTHNTAPPASGTPTKPATPAVKQ